MNRIDTLFSKKSNNLLSVFFTAGHPSKDSTIELLKGLENAGADLVEIGIPYSDPMADGPIIQHSSKIALDNGMSLELLFSQLKAAKGQTSIPKLLMGYMNPVMQFGVEKFCQECVEAEVDGVILPDMPIVEYKRVYKKLFEVHGLYFVFLISPQTPDERAKELDELSSGFLYLVSSASTTGANKDLFGAQEVYYKRIQALGLKHPMLTGFGIHDHATFSLACKYSSGAIIGSAFIKAVEASNNLSATCKEFVKEIKGE